MSNLIEPTPEDPAGGSAGPNRTFILIALGLAGLLVVGLLGVFGYVAASRFGLLGARENPTPVTSPAAATPAGTRAATAVAAGTGAPANATPVAVTSAPTRVIAVATSVATAAATKAPTSAAVAPTATRSPTGASGSSGGGTAAEATATPDPAAGAGGTTALPQTGAELDLLIIAGLLAVLLVLARSFRSVLRS